MSRLTEIILLFSGLEDAEDMDDDDECDVRYFVLDEINAWLGKNDYGRFGKSICNVAGGPKVWPSPTYAATFNNFDFDRFVDYLKSVKWIYPQYVQLIVCEERFEEFDFKMIRVMDK